MQVDAQTKQKTMNTNPYSQTRKGLNLVKNMLVPQRNAWLTDIFKATIARMGQKTTIEGDKVVEYALTDFATILIPQNDSFSQDEIEEVLRLGATGELGDNIAMSSRTLTTWFKNYLNDYRPKVAAKLKESEPVKMLAEAPVPKLTVEMVIEHLREVYEDYHAGHIVMSRTYDIAVQFGLMPDKYTDLKRFQDLARLEVTKDSAQRLNKGVLSIQDYQTAIKNTNDGSPLDQAMKRAALCAWFDWMKLGKGFKVEQTITQ